MDIQKEGNSCSRSEDNSSSRSEDNSSSRSEVNNSSGSEVYICSLCGITCKSKSRFTFHLKKHKKGPNKNNLTSYKNNKKARRVKPREIVTIKLIPCSEKAGHTE